MYTGIFQTFDFFSFSRKFLVIPLEFSSKSYCDFFENSSKRSSNIHWDFLFIEICSVVLSEIYLGIPLEIPVEIA